MQLSEERIKAMKAALEYPKNALYQPIEHPAFQSANQCAVQPCTERWHMMQEWLKLNPVLPRSVVDIGCHTGWFCRQFARHGWDALGVDRSETWLGVARELAAWSEVPGQDYQCCDWTGWPLPPDVGAVLFLSAIMYVFRDNPEAVAWQQVNRLSEMAPVMFIDWGGMYAKHLPFSESTFVREMKRRTTYTKGELLGRTGLESRPFYVLTREG